MHSISLFRFAPLGTLVLGLALSGCAVTQTATTPADGVRTLAGEITTRSAVNHKDGTRYQSFTLNLRQGEMIRVSQEGALSAPVFTLLDQQQQLINGPRPGTLYLTPPADGRYTLTVSGADSSAYGPFRLTLESVIPHNQGELVVGEPIHGVLTGSANQYQLTVSEAGLYELTLDSDEFDAVLKLQGNGLELEDDDGGTGTNSRLSTLLQAGSYQVIAGSWGDSEAGVYSLALNRRTLPADLVLVNEGALRLGDEITGLATSEARTYSLNVPSRGMLRLRMSSVEVDSYLQLEGQGLNVTDDDGAGQGYDAQIVTLVEPGSYSVKASSVGSDSGLFTLSSSLSPVRSVGSLVRPGDAVAGSLSNGRTATTTLRISEAGSYRIELYSSAFDAYLKLEGNGRQEEDDDGAGGTNAGLNLHLEPGDYQLIGSAYGNSGSGDYLLLVEAR